MTINAVYVTLCFEYFSINNLLHKYNKLMQKIAKKPSGHILKAFYHDILVSLLPFIGLQIRSTTDDLWYGLMLKSGFLFWRFAVISNHINHKCEKKKPNNN